MRPTTCPHCGRENEFHDGPTPDAKPKPDDVSLCWRCGGLSFYTEDLSLRLPTPEETRELEADPGVRKARAAIAESSTPTQASELRWL